MARNGIGVFNLAQAAFVNGTVIDATAVNSDLTDIGNEITNSLAKDGQTPATGNLNLSTFKIINSGAGLNLTDLATLAQEQTGVATYVTTVAGTNTITGNINTPAIVAYTIGQTFRFIAAGNNTGATTLNINAIGAKAITKNGANPLGSNDIVANSTISVIYDGTQFQLLNATNSTSQVNVVSSIAGLRALLKTSSISRALVTGYYAQGDGGGGIYYYDATDTTSVDSGGDIIVATDGGRWKLVTNGILQLRQFGAYGDNTTDDATAIANWFAAIIRTGLEGYINAGTFRIATTGTTTWDFSSVRLKAPKIKGAGKGISIFNFTNLTTGIGFQLKANLDWYELSISDLTLKANYAGVFVTIGDNSYVDPLNVANFTNLAILNSANSALNVALRLNYVVNSNFIGCRANAYANGSGLNVGTALECRQAAFNTFTNGSYGNGAYGVNFKDGFSYGNTFVSTDHENVNYCVATNSSGAGNNTFIGGQFSLWSTNAFTTNGSLNTNAITVINANYSNGANPAPRIDPVNFSYIRIIDGTTISTPAVPATGVAVYNITGKRVLVTFWAGTITQVTVNGFNVLVTNGSVVVEHGQTVSLTYTGSPSWLWQKLE